MKNAEQKRHREDAIQRLISEENVSHADARMLVEVLGVDWPSLKRESDLMKVEAMLARKP